MQTVTCPTCGGYMGELPDFNRVKERLTFTEQKVAAALIDAEGEGLDVFEVTAVLYGQERTDEKALDVARQILSRVRRKLEPHGYHMPRKRGFTLGKYRILPAEVGPC